MVSTYFKFGFDFVAARLNFMQRHALKNQNSLVFPDHLLKYGNTYHVLITFHIDSYGHGCQIYSKNAKIASLSSGQY